MKTLAQLEQDAQDLANQIKALKEAEAHEPWEPKNGEFLCGNLSRITRVRTQRNKQGRLFQTQEAAEQAASFFTFYQRLYQLALECNAKHEATRPYYIGFDGTVWLPSIASVGYTCPARLATSHAAAREACNIMNRDQWIMPTM